MKKRTFHSLFTIDNLIIFIYFAVYIIIGLSMVYKQPFGNPPDEYNRYLIPEYIAKYGTLPNGYDEEIRISGYGFSYGFQPILPYMLQGYTMRLVQLVTDSEMALLYAGRMVDFALGLMMAALILRLSRLWFEDKRLQYLFSFLVTFLPQAIFVHTYVNTDSCCMLSIAIMLYGLTKGLKDNFSYRSCIWLSVGIILCALSYYNAYGFILSCILLFMAHYLSFAKNSPHLDVVPFLKKGCFISAIVLLGISWWFIRSYLLYDGDILGLASRDACAAMYASPTFHPDTRQTLQTQGYSILEMLTQTDFVNLSILSFIGIYGPMAIVTSIWIYRFYKYFFLVVLLACIFLQGNLFRSKESRTERHWFVRFYHGNMIFCIIMPIVLSIYYSYTTDYQPQGRYLLPMLIPFCYYCIRGLEKGMQLFFHLVNKRKALSTQQQSRMVTDICVILCCIIVISLFITVYGYAFPYYEANPIAP